MNYQASVSDFLRIARRKSNLLLGGVCMLIPMIGPLVLSGWHITCLWARGNRDDAADFPPFDFQYFGKYLERGVWPFVVSLVLSVVFVPVVMLIIFLPMGLGGVFFSKGHPSGELAIALFFGVFALQISSAVLYQLISSPFILRATITQDFKASFDFRFAGNFVAVMWKELLTSLLFMFALWLCLVVITIVTCYVGIFFAMPVVLFSWNHLKKQIYQLYLARGGEAVPLSPKLQDLPPALPPPSVVAG